MDTIRRLCTTSTSEDNTDGNSAKKKDSEIWIVAAERGKAISWFNHALGRTGDNSRARNSPSLARLQCLQADSSRLAERLTAIRGGLMTDMMMTMTTSIFRVNYRKAGGMRVVQSTEEQHRVIK